MQTTSVKETTETRIPMKLHYVRKRKERFRRRPRPFVELMLLVLLTITSSVLSFSPRNLFIPSSPSPLVTLKFQIRLQYAISSSSNYNKNNFMNKRRRTIKTTSTTRIQEKDGALDDDKVSSSQSSKKNKRRRDIPRKIVQIYAEYASRLWKETSTDERHRIANDKLAVTIRQVQTILKEASDDKGKNHGILEYANVPLPDRENLYNACEQVLRSMTKKSDECKKNYNGNTTNVNGMNAHSEVQLHGGDNNNNKSSNVAASTNLNGSAMAINGPKLSNGDIGSSLPSSLSANGATIPAVKGVVPVLAEQMLTTKQAKPKNRRSIAFGALMGAVVTCWVFSGNYIFTGLFTLMTILGQLEYYRMIMNTGTYPARRISVLGACSMFLTALLCPDLHQICLPIFGLWAMVWFLTMRKSRTTIPEITTTFTGMFYLGYVPSFWVRIRLIGMGREPTRLAPIVGPILSFIGNTAEASTLIPNWLPQAIHLPITTGAIFIFWSWLCLAFSDVGAYFVGKNFGKTKLSAISPAAGMTSPNKSVEGVVGGCTVSAMLAIFGAWVQRWPYPIVTGTIHGILLGLLGLLGDLTASMLKRDAGLKDFGDLLPEHGGIMDRVDSFIWSAPYSWLVCAYIIPALKQMVKS